MKTNRLLWAMLAIATACAKKDGTQPDSPNGSSAGGGRDSAGIQIVDQGAPAPATLELADGPSLDIGGKLDDQSELTAVIGAVLLSDGTVVIGSAPNTIRFFGPDGKLKATVGKQGSGPGEFRMLNGIWVGPGDSILASDLGQMRMTIFGPDGKIGRSFGLGGSTGMEISQEGGVSMTIPHGQLSDGTIIGSRLNYNMSGPSRGVYRDSLTLTRYGTDGAAKNSVGRFPALEMMTLDITIAGQTMGMPSPLPLGRQTIIVPGKDRIYIAENIHWEVKEVSPDGKVIRYLRLELPPVVPSTAEVEAKRKEQLDEIANNPALRMMPTEMKDQFLKQVREIPIPKTLPWIVAMTVSPSGRLWVEQPAGHASEPRKIAVFDANGKSLGMVTAPPQFTITGATDEQVVGLVEGDDNAIRVKVYRIAK